jgi:pyrroline-5-carboxylate reductase
MKVGFLGGGAMGEAMIAAITAGETPVAAANDIRLFDVVAPRVLDLVNTYGIEGVSSPADLVGDTDFVLLSVKPQDFEKAAAPLAGKLGNTTALSIMAGVTLARLSRVLQSDNVVRAMPNTPAQIGQGMTGWTATDAVSDTAREGARRIFGAMGREAFVPNEKYIDMVTGLSGSGPAYVFLFIEALTDAGVHVGLPRDIAATMALQTVIGSALYAEKTGKHPAELRNQVTSPGGTTAEGLRALEQGNLRADVLEAVIAAYEKSKALGEESKS